MKINQRVNMNKAKYVVKGYTPELILQDQSKSPMMTAIGLLRAENKDNKENEKLMRIVKSNITPIF